MTGRAMQPPIGYNLLHDPHRNKATAFTNAERHKYRLERLVAYIFDHGLARVARPDDVGALVRVRTYHPVYKD